MGDVSGHAARGRVWALADSKRGTAEQCLGVAEALGVPFEIKDLDYASPAALPNVALGASLNGLTVASRSTVVPPWPDIVIAAGRRTAPVARYIKRQTGGKAFLAQIMHPGRAGIDAFDLIAVPNHDRIATRPNLLRITGAPHRITADRLAGAADAWRDRFSGLPRPWIALIVGGATRRRGFSDAVARNLARRARGAAKSGSLLVTTSRRTGRAADVLIAALKAPDGPTLFLHDWRGGGDNPYVAFLALADAVIVTGDSVSMCCEACTGGQPVYIFAPPGFASPKHRRLHQELYDHGLARPFDGAIAAWRHPSLNAAVEVARAIQEKLCQRQIR